MKDFYKIIRDSGDLKKTYIRLMAYLKDKFEVPGVTLFHVNLNLDHAIGRFEQIFSVGVHAFKPRSAFNIDTEDFLQELLESETHFLHPDQILYIHSQKSVPDDTSVLCIPVRLSEESFFCSLLAGSKSQIDKVYEDIYTYVFFFQNHAEKIHCKNAHQKANQLNRQLRFGLSKTQQNLKEHENILQSLNTVSSIGVAFLQNHLIYNFDKGFQQILQMEENDIPDNLDLRKVILNYSKIKETITKQINKPNPTFFECQFKTLKSNTIDVQVFITSSKLDDSIHLISIQDISKRKSAERLQDLIYTINKAVNTTSNVYEFTLSIKQALHDWIDTSNFYLALYHPEDDEISLPFFDDEKDVFDRLPARKTLTGNVIKSRQPIMLNRQEIEALLSLGDIELIGSIPEIWMGIPLIHQNAVIGMIGLQNYISGNTFTSEQFKLMQYLADQFSFLIMKKKQEVNLQEAIQRAMESDRLKTSFLSNISHEIRTPMNSILGFSELLSDDDLSNEERSQYIELIHQNGHDLMNLINDMIDIAKIEAGEIKLAKTDFSVQDLLLDVKKANQKQAEQMDVNIRIDPSPTPHDIVLFTDPFRLQQIMNNLVDNGIKYGLSRDVRIGFKLRDNDEFVELYVIDRGIGISEDMHEVIFDPFRQANESHIKTTGGNGLGLSISKSLTQLLGGKIYLDSKEGYGSRFCIRIPIEKEKFIESSKHYSSSFNWTGKHILVAEDVLHNFQFLDMMFKKSGAEVSWARNGEEAVKMCKKGCPYDLILMDVQMPIMDGLKATRIIKNQYPDVPIIAQTAFAQTTSKEDVYAAGCDDFIFKPIQTHDLLQKVARFLTDKNDMD